MNQSTTRIRPPAAALRLLVALVLAVGLAPLPAFTGQAAADDLAAATLGAQGVTPISLDKQSVEAAPGGTFSVSVNASDLGAVSWLSAVVDNSGQVRLVEVRAGSGVTCDNPKAMQSAADSSQRVRAVVRAGNTSTPLGAGAIPVRLKRPSVLLY